MAPETVENEALRLAPEDYPQIDHLVTEDNSPMDNIFSEKQQRLLTEPLYSSWRIPERRFIVLANVGLFHTTHDPAIVPDTLLSLDVSLPESLFPKANRSYFTWMYGTPDVVVEIVSNREGNEDTSKQTEYARIRIPYYAIYDPEGWLSKQPLRVFQLRGRSYQLMSEPYWLPDVDLGLRIWEGQYEDHTNTWLRWCDGAGNVIPTGAERAEQEKQRAEQEKQRAERLAAQLRARGIEPEV